MCASAVLTLEEAKAALEEANPGRARARQAREKRASPEAEADRARVRQETEAAGGGAAARLVVRQAAEA